MVPGTENGNKQTNVIITLAEIHKKLSAIGNDTLLIKSELRRITGIEHEIENLMKRLNKLEIITSAHSVIISIMTAIIVAVSIGAIQ